jgi:hypothetical protein
MMLKEEAMTIHNLEDELAKTLTIIPVKEMPLEKYEIVWQGEK